MIGRKWRHSKEVASSVPSPNSTCHNTTVQQRREILDKWLSNYKQERLKRKIATVPTDMQLLDYAKEELEIEKRLVDQLDKMEKQYSDNMRS